MKEVAPHPVLCLVAALALVALAGCQSLTRSAQQEPDWVSSPPESRSEASYVAAVGSARVNGDREEARRAADRAARRKLAGHLEEYVQSVGREFLAAQTDPPASETSTEDFVGILASEVVSDVMRRASLEDSWDGPTGNAYAFYKIPIADVNERVVDGLGTATQIVNPVSNDLQATRKAMATFLNRRTKERLRETAGAPRPAGQPSGRPQAPDWLQTGRHPDYPQGRYLVAAGVGEDRTKAEFSARQDIAARIQKALSQSAGPEDAGAPSPGEDDALAFAKTFPEQALPSTRVVDTWLDDVTGTMYVLAVLDRKIAELVFAERSRQALGRYEELSKSGRNHEKAGNVAAALRDYLDAWLAARETIVAQTRASAFSLADANQKGDPLADAASLETSARSAFTDLLSRVSLDKVSGDGQWVSPGGLPLKPLRVRAVAAPDGQPVQRLPVRLSLSHAGQPEQAASTETGPDGTAGWTAMEPLSNGDTACTIVAEVDLSGWTEHPLPSGSAMPRATFRCVLRSKASTRFLVAVRSAEDNVPAAQSFREAIVRALQQRGYSVSAYQAASDQLARLDHDLILDPDAVAAAVRGPNAQNREQVPLAIVARMRTSTAETVPTTQGNLRIAHAGYELLVVDPAMPEGQRTTVELSGTGKGAYVDDSYEAAARAREQAATAASEQLLAELERRFQASDTAG